MTNPSKSLTDSTLQRQPKGKLENFINISPINKFLSIGKPTITVLRLQGIIGKFGTRAGITLDNITKEIEEAFAPSNLLAVCLIINSPGGSPVQSELISKKILHLSSQKKVPVYSFIEDLAASGGYWLACSGREIYASKSSIIGSIGVITSGFGFVELIKKIGVERRIFTEGSSKSILDPFSNLKDEDVKILNSAQKEIHKNFTEFIKESRKGKLTQSDEFLFNGAFWAGSIALDYGLIDGIDDVYSFIEQNFGTKINIKHIKQKKSFCKKFIGASSSQYLLDIIHKYEETSMFNRFLGK